MRKKKKKPCYRRVNGPAQRCAHAGGARFRPANGRSIGIAEEKGTGIEPSAVIS
jgi:hypothetical protein